METKLKKKQDQIAKLKDLGLEEREFEALDSGALQINFVNRRQQAKLDELTSSMAENNQSGGDVTSTAGLVTSERSSQKNSGVGGIAATMKFLKENMIKQRERAQIKKAVARDVEENRLMALDPNDPYPLNFFEYLQTKPSLRLK